MQRSGAATLIRPAPDRNADWAAIAIAPVIPRQPPISNPRPKFPLCESIDRRGSFGRSEEVVMRLSFFERLLLDRSRNVDETAHGS